MYILKTGLINNNNSNCYRQYSNCVTFKQSANANAVLKKQSFELAQRYLRCFAKEIFEYRAEGEKILQPYDIPFKKLQVIAQKELTQMMKFPTGKKLFIVTGRIGGGKSTFVEQNKLNEIFYTPDSDEIKPFLPGYKKMGAGYVHKASWTINSVNLSEALKRGIDTIVQTATTIDNLDDIIDEARDYGYQDIVMIHIDTNEENAIKRASARANVTGRFVDPNEIRNRRYIDIIVPTYKTPLRGLSQLIVYNNNGKSPVKVEDINLQSQPENLTYVTESDD